MSTRFDWNSESDQATRLVGVAIRLTRTLRALTRTSAYGGPQISALAAIVSSGRITGRDLARLEEVTPATISRLVVELERSDLVRREHDIADARKQWISATSNGRAVVIEGHARRVQPLLKATAALSEMERAELDAGLKIIEGLVTALANARLAAP